MTMERTDVSGRTWSEMSRIEGHGAARPTASSPQEDEYRTGHVGRPADNLSVNTEPNSGGKYFWKISESEKAGMYPRRGQFPPSAKNPTNIILTAAVIFTIIRIVT